MADPTNCHRFFAERVKFLRNESRVVAVTHSSIIGYDHQDKQREKVDFVQLQHVICSKKPNELVIKPRDGEAITYTCEARDNLAALVLQGYDIAYNNKGTLFRVDRIGREETTNVCLWISSSVLTRTDMSGTTTLSEKLLTDIEYIAMTFEQNDFIVKFKHSAAQAHRYSSPQRGQVVEKITATLRDIFGVTINVLECPKLGDVIYANVPDKSHYLFETKAKKHYATHEPRDCIFALTRSHVIITDKNSKIWSCREINSITALVLHQEQFSIQYQYVYYARFTSLDRETILANLLGISKEYGHSLEVICREPAPGLQVLPLPRHDDPKVDDYFVQKLLYVTEHSSDPSQFQENINVIQEYNANVPLIGPTIKEKKVILCIFGWLQYAWSALWEARPDSRNMLMEEVLDLLGTLTRIFSSSRSALEEATNAKALKPLLLIVLKSGFFKLNYGVCALVQSMISHHDPRANKQATINRNFVFTNDVLEEIMTLLSKSVPKYTNTLATYLFTNLLECCLYTQIHSTDWQLAKILATLLQKNLAVLFDLCRSPCRAVAKNLTILIEFVLQEAKSDQNGFRILQDDCRNQCALVWQIYLAVSTPARTQSLRQSQDDFIVPPVLPHAHSQPIISSQSSGNLKSIIPASNLKPLFARVAGSMAEGNQASLDVIARMFPLHLFERMSSSENISDKFRPKHDKKSKIAVMPGDQSWYHFFERIQQDFEEPNLVWNAATRKELCETIVQSVEHYHEWKTSYPTSKHVWNYEEFVVKYKCLDDQLKVGKYYVNTILNLGNHCQLAQPEIFVDMIIHKLLMLHNPTAHQIAYLRAVTWCYSKYHANIASYTLRIENMLVLLDTQPQSVVDHVLLFFEEIFLVKKNVREFVKYGGVEKVVKLLEVTTNKTTKVTEDELGAYTRLSTIANILSVAMSVTNHLDANGVPKVPIPYAKSLLSDSARMSILTNVVASLCSKPADATRDYVMEGIASLLDQIMSYNDAVTANIYKTGLIYFLLYFDGPSFLANAKLLLKIHNKQTLRSGSILQDYLPEPMIELMGDDVVSFAEVFTSSSSTPVLVWSNDMREHLRKNINFEIQPFLQQLAKEGAGARYEFTQINIQYPNLESYCVIGKYYVDYLVDERYATWQIPNREAYFVQVCSYLQSLSQLPPHHRLCLLRLIRQQYQKVPNLLAFTHYPSFNQWIERFVFDEVIPNLAQAGADMHVETICEVVKLLHTTSHLSTNMETFMSHNGKTVLYSCLKCLTVSSKFEFSFRDLIMDCLLLVLEWMHRDISQSSQTLEPIHMFDFVKCTVSPPVSSSVCSLALDCIHVIAQQQLNLQSLYDIGTHYYLLRVILRYVGAKRAKNLTVEEEGPLSNLAVSATRILAVLSVLEPVKAVLINLLTQENVEKLSTPHRRQPDPIVFINAVASPIEMESTWDVAALDRLNEKVHAWINEYGLLDTPEIVNKHVLNTSAQLQVGSIYLYAFNANPTAETHLPIDFLIQLLNALHHLFMSPTSHDPTFTNNAMTLVLAINNALELKLPPPADALNTLVPTIINSHAPEKYTYIVLDIISTLLTNERYHDPLAQEIRLNAITRILQSIPQSRTVFLPIIGKLTKERSPDFPDCILSSNILLTILQYFMDNEPSNAYRGPVTSILHELAIAPSCQSVLPIFQHIFPEYLVKAITKFDTDEIITLFDMNTASAEFIWNEKMRKEVSEFVASCLAEGIDLQDKPFAYSELENELQICNVYLNQYNKAPVPFTMTSPSQFLHSLIAALHAPSTTSPTSFVILQSLHHLISAYPELILEFKPEYMALLIGKLTDEKLYNQPEYLHVVIKILRHIAKDHASAFVLHQVLDSAATILHLPQKQLHMDVLDLVELLVSSTIFCDSVTKGESIVNVLRSIESDTHANEDHLRAKASSVLFKISSIDRFNEWTRSLKTNGHARKQRHREAKRVAQIEVNAQANGEATTLDGAVKAATEHSHDSQHLREEPVEVATNGHVKAENEEALRTERQENGTHAQAAYNHENDQTAVTSEVKKDALAIDHNENDQTTSREDALTTANQDEEQTTSSRDEAPIPEEQDKATMHGVENGAVESQISS